MNPDLSKYFWRCLIRTGCSDDQFFEADHLPKQLKTLNIRWPKKPGNVRSTCCPPIQKTQAIRCSNSLKLRCLIQKSNPRLQAHKRCCRILTNDLQHLYPSIFLNGLPDRGESRSEMFFLNPEKLQMPRAVLFSLESKGGVVGT